MVASGLLLPLCVFLVLQAGQAWHGRASKDNTTFHVPATGASGYCETYDLSKLAAIGGINFTNLDGYNYTLGLCADLDRSKIPVVCRSHPAAPAYQFNAAGCNALGKLESTVVYPVDSTSSSAGLRLGYNNGEGGAEYWPRAVIYDLFCDPGAGVGEPRWIAEYPQFTYTVRWHTALACPGQRVKMSCPTPKYDGTWNTVRFRPKPSWYDEVKFGIFLHWGVYSVPSFLNEWYWKRLEEGTAAYVEFHNRVYGCSGVKPDKFPCTGPSFSYPEFAEKFHAELFDPDQWAQLFKAAGAKYVVLTSKHHEGWCNFKNSYHWNWNSVDVGPQRDLVGDLAKSVRAAGLHMGLYHSLREWYHPLYILDQENNCSTTSFVDEVLLPTMKQMVEEYQPEVIWADGAGDAPCTHDSVKYWKAPQFLSWVYNDSPVKDTIMVDSRWGTNGFGDYNTGSDRYTPGQLIPYKWESAFTVQSHTWGFDRTAPISEYLNSSRLILQLVESVSCNGNLLLNVGPTVDGRIVPAFQERLLEMGAWLKINGEAIYNSTPWRFQNDTNKLTWYTASKDGITVYAITLAPPTPGSSITLRQAVASAKTTVNLLGYSEPLKFSMDSAGLHITFPVIPYGTLVHAWTFKLTYITPKSD